MSIGRGIKKALCAVPLLAVAAWVVPTTRAEANAAPVPEESEVVAPADVAGELALAASSCTYYNNAQHSQVVGQFGYDCCNNYVAWGRKTAFKDCGGCFPCVPPPR